MHLPGSLFEASDVSGQRIILTPGVYDCFIIFVIFFYCFAPEVYYFMINWYLSCLIKVLRMLEGDIVMNLSNQFWTSVSHSESIRWKQIVNNGNRSSEETLQQSSLERWKSSIRVETGNKEEPFFFYFARSIVKLLLCGSECIFSFAIVHSWMYSCKL